MNPISSGPLGQFKVKIKLPGLEVVNKDCSGVHYGYDDQVPSVQLIVSKRTIVQDREDSIPKR